MTINPQLEDIVYKPSNIDHACSPLRDREIEGISSHGCALQLMTGVKWM